MSHKKLLKHCVLWLKMGERIVSVELFVYFPLLYLILVNFVLSMQFIGTMQGGMSKEWHEFILTMCDYW